MQQPESYPIKNYQNRSNWHKSKDKDQHRNEDMKRSECYKGKFTRNLLRTNKYRIVILL